MNIIDHGENDGLDFDLSGFEAVAHGIRASLVEQGLMRSTEDAE